MKNHLIILVVTMLMAACSRSSDEQAATRSIAGAKSAASHYMAYEHQIELEANAEQVAQIHDDIVTNCQQAVATHCVVLESSLRTGEFASSRVQIRATAEGIASAIASLSQHGEIVSQTKTGEDLENAVVDTEKRLSMLKDYRSKLETLSARGNNDITALMQITKELSQTQSEIENLTGAHAHLLQRIATELLTVEIQSRHAKSFWRPISNAISDFGDNLSESLATTVTAIAYLLPWLTLLALAIWIVRKWWRKRRT